MKLNKHIIIAETNFLEEDLWKIYLRKKEFDLVTWQSIKFRLQTIRNEVRKEEVNNET